MSASTAALYPRQNTLFVNLLLLIAVCFALALPFPGQPAGLGQTALPAPAAADSQALQLQSGEHVLRFEPGGISMSGLDHSLNVEFLGTPGVTPRASRVSAGAYQEVRYAELWQGVTARFSLSGGAIAKSEFLVAPGGNPASIRLRYSVAPELRGDGSLVFAFPEAGGEVVEAAPVAWQDVAGQRHPVPVAFSLSASGEVGYTLGAYDPALPLVIDPDYRWHTFYGGSPTSELVGTCAAGNFFFGAGWALNGFYRQGVENPLGTYYFNNKDIVVTLQDAAHYYRKVEHFGSAGDDYPKGIVCSGSNAYIVGTSSGSWTGPGGEPPVMPYSGGTDIFVLALAVSGTDMVYSWHTFLGSQDLDVGRGIALSGSELYLAGASYSGWDGPTSINPLHSYSGGYDIVVINLTTSGSYHWHTFYGSQADELGTGIAANTSEVWVSGLSDASWRGPASANPIHAHSGGGDITALKLDADGAYTWHTFYGSSGNEAATGVVLHSTSGAGFIAGYSATTWQGDGNTAPLHAHVGGNDFTVLALSGAGAYDWHTFYGSTNNDEARGLAIDNTNSLYVGGVSTAGWYGPAAEEPVDGYAGRNDIAVLKLNARGVYTWHAFYGGDGLDQAQGIQQAGGTMALSGSSNAGWLGPLFETPTGEYLGGTSAVAVYIGATGEYQEHTFFGTGSDDSAAAIAADLNGNIILSGSSAGSWRGPANQAPLRSFSGMVDIFVLKMDSSAGYLWHTFYGCARSDYPVDVTTDTAGNIYILGYSTQSWNGPAGQAPVSAYSDASDIFVLKLNAGGAYQWHTFLGGSRPDYPSEIVFSNAASALYISGYSYANWVGNGVTAPLHAFSGDVDILVASLSAGTGAYQWHTFYGTAGDERGYGIAASSNAVYVTGYSAAWNGPAGQAPLHSHDGSASNLYLLKLNTAGGYAWHTFYGSLTSGSDVTLDSSSNLYLLGSSTNDWLGPAGQAPTHPFATHSAVVLKLNSSGAYQWHGFFGGTNMSMPEKIALDQRGEIWASLEASVPWQAYGSVAPLNPFQGGRDTVLLHLTSQGVYRRHTYIGGSLRDESAGLAISPFGLVLVGGSHPSTWQYQGNAALHAFNETTEVSVIAFSPLEQVFLPVAIK